MSWMLGWHSGREFNRRIKKVFNERGIEIPFPHHALYWGQSREGTPTPLRVSMENHPPVRREDEH
jgi:small conductance mechanosensitive channel